jgi:hypothetical protein
MASNLLSLPSHYLNSSSKKHHFEGVRTCWSL